ncbi:MAG: AbrB/MazE/SpoVT family DNA-binding domain-containing protein [Patescibacteria group bacterium]
MTQKILKVGTSAAVTIPKKTMDLLGLHVGDRVQLKVGRDKKISIAPVGISDDETIAWTRAFIKRYRPALKALSKK